MWLIDRLLCHSCRVQILVVRFHDPDWLRCISPPRIAPYEIRWATREEVMAAADGEPEWLDAARARAALDRGERCMGAFLDGRMVSCSWSTSSGPLCPGLTIHVRADCVYGQEAKTRRAHRGKGLYGAIVMNAGHAAALEGRCMVGYVYAGNTRAVSGAARMGRMSTGFILCRDGANPWFWISPHCRREGIRISREPEGVPAVTT